MTAKKTLTAAMCILLFILCGCTKGAEVGMPTQGALLGASEQLEAGWHMTAVPAAIMEKVAEQPDTMEYAAHYVYFGEKDMDMDISADVTQGEVPLFLQWDKRWGYAYYGSNYMGINGCAPPPLPLCMRGSRGKPT